MAARIILPSVLLRVVNHKLERLEGYEGHVEDIDMALIFGSYTIQDIRIVRTGGKIPVPFFSAKDIKMSVEWKALFHGAFVGEIEVVDPVLNYVLGPTPATTQTGVGKKWQDIADELLPLRLNSFEITNGEVHYRDYYSVPKVDIYTKDIHIMAKNLSNVNKNKDLLPSTVEGTAHVYGGSIALSIQLDPLNEVPTFDMNAELQNMHLVALNDFLKAYGNFDVQQGNFGVYMEAAAKESKIVGYTKPIVKDLDVVEWKDEKEDPLGQKLWESLIGFGAWVFKNKKTEQLATRIEFSGDVKDPDIPLMTIVGETLRNAFVKALYPSLENVVNIRTVDANKPIDELVKQKEKKTEGKKKKLSALQK
ncbi:MAG: DUF748 domain-containing protein [Chitinophagales bacterium]